MIPAPNDPIWVTTVKAIALVFGLLGAFAYMTYVERRLLGRFQMRQGPNMVGPAGLLQPIADAIKSIFKEDIIVGAGDRFIIWFAPLLSITVALMAFGALPAGPPGALFGANPWLLDLDVGFLYLLAVSSMAVYGVVLAGWGSNNKYSLLGSLRASAQMISYEISLGLSLVGIVIITGEFNIRAIVDWQGDNVWLVVPQLVAFGTFMVANYAEVGRPPFDLPEAESELVAGFMTEYSSIKWALFQMAEYVHMITASAITATLFFGGWRAPLGLPDVPFLWFLLKTAFFMFLFIWTKATLPRFRYDQLMDFGWKVLLPISLANAVGTAVVVVLL